MGQTNLTASGLTAGTYSVTVTDQTGCIIVGSHVVTEPMELLGLVTSTNATCGLADGTASVAVSGGTAPYSYEWDDTNAQTTSMATGLETGSYQVLITDANGCLITESATIGSNGEPLLIISSSDVSCHGNNDGIGVTSVSNGTPPFTYLWNDALAQTNATATGLSPGTYGLTLTDGTGCMVVGSCIIDEPVEISVVVTIIDASFGSCTGKATVSVSGGIAPYSYLWSGGQTNETAVDLCPGNYTVMVTDANGCTMEGIVIVNELVGLETLDRLDVLRIYPNPSNGQFNLVFPQLGGEELSIMVTDIIGQVVYSTFELATNGEGELKLDLSQNPNGVYQLRMITDQFILVRPVIIH